MFLNITSWCSNELEKEHICNQTMPFERDAHKRLANEMKVFVGNLSVETTENDLRQAFESFGRVRSVTIVMDGILDKSRTFGFVIMPSANDAKNAIEKMNGKDLQGRKIDVEKSRARRKPRAGGRKRSDFANRGKSGGHRGRRC